MKNIFRIGRTARDGTPSSLDQNNRSLSATSWNFQASATTLRGGSPSLDNKRHSFRAFRALGQSFFDAEAKRGERIDGAIFALIMMLAVWPLAGAAQAVVHLMK